MGYTKTAVKGISWVGLFRAVMRATAIVRTIILARLLTPHDFGLFGVAALVLGLIEMFTETGINVFLIQQDDENALDDYLNTAWVVSIVRGFLITLVILLSAPAIVGFFGSNDALSLINLISLVPLIRGFINPAIVNFQKQLRFNSEFWFRSTVVIADALIAIILAFSTRSPISLAWGLIAAASVEVLLSQLLIQPKPKFKFHRTQLIEIINKGKWVTSAGIFAFFANKSADISIGKVLDTISLGYYQMAYRFAVIPVEEIIEIFNKVSFPIYSKIIGDKPRIKSAFIKNYIAVVGLAAPFTLVMFLLAGPFTQLVLGEKWLSIIPYLKLLSLLSLTASLAAPCNPLFLAAKRQDYLSLVSFFRLIILSFILIPLTFKYGIQGAILAYMFSIIIDIPVRFYLVRKIFSS